MFIYTVKQFFEKLELALKSNTVYGTGGFGACLNNKNQLERYCKNTPELEKVIRERAAKGDAFAFDCVGLIKGILWGWNANTSSIYGGAEYKSNGVPDTGCSGMLSRCSDVSSDFSKIIPGELLYMDGHVGIYAGDGMAYECTSAWDKKVQKVECWNVKKTGRGRKWEKHGKLPWIDYSGVIEPLKVVISGFKTKDECSKFKSALSTLLFDTSASLTIE